MAQPVLEIDNLSVQFNLKRGVLRAIDQISFDVGKGETFGLVGESGSGKSVTARAIMRLIPSPPGEIATGTVRFQGRDLYQMPDDEIREIRGQNIAMVFQEPMNALNPVFTVGSQIGDALWTNMGMSKQEARERTIEMLQLVGIPSPSDRVDNYVHEFSGGMRQRVMLAMALSCDPTFLIADEPTTALDVTIQAQILKLLKDLQNRMNMALLLITHDLSMVRRIADRVCVMDQGTIVEEASTHRLFDAPAHACTKALLSAVPKPDPDSRLDLTALMAGRCSDPGAWQPPFTVDDERQPRLVDLGAGHFVRAAVSEQEAGSLLA